jgi:glycine/D-amino acid oxidase-like deaminating enzyme
VSGGYDLAVIGGGIMGCGAALRVAETGMRPIVLEQSEIGSGASGVNAGTLSLQIKRVKLVPYALKGYALWQAAGDAVGFRRTGGFTLAFNDAEATLLAERMALKREAGAPVEMISPNRVAAMEPGLSRRIVAASWCAADGYANSSLTGVYYRARLRAAGIEAREHCRVEAIEAGASGFAIRAQGVTIRASRLLLACGAWTKAVAALVGLDLPVAARVNTVSVTERGPRIVGTVIGHATGLLTLKQKPNGTVLIGGGWQGRGAPQEGRGEVSASTLLTNLRLAQFAVPALADLRILRSWTGFDAAVPDFYPLAGAAPGIPGAYLLACVRGGYTIGPYISRLVGDLILEREPEMPLFDPARFTAPNKGEAS